MGQIILGLGRALLAGACAGGAAQSIYLRFRAVRPPPDLRPVASASFLPVFALARRALAALPVLHPVCRPGSRAHRALRHRSTPAAHHAGLQLQVSLPRGPAWPCCTSAPSLASARRCADLLLPSAAGSPDAYHWCWATPHRRTLSCAPPEPTDPATKPTELHVHSARPARAARPRVHPHLLAPARPPLHTTAPHHRCPVASLSGQVLGACW